MSEIKILSPQLASQIAAGEVVERPASVVKELLENAVDAGADKILCEIRGAGRILIRVRDNGSGMSADDLPLALKPHATSKISSLSDLEAILTLGFRGEALASIASVSRLTISSKRSCDEYACKVSVDGPQMNPTVSPAAQPDGTTIDVEDLFFNTPARRRFLKSDRTENARIRDIFIRVALAHPQCGFELVCDGKTQLQVYPSKDPSKLDLKRICTLLGSEFKDPAVSLDFLSDPLKLQGLILIPRGSNMPESDRMYLFLNGRPVADKVITHAVKEGYYACLGENTNFRGVLYLKVPPESVDVNVHPRKDEVRFHETGLIHDLIVQHVEQCLRSYLEKKSGAPSSELDLSAASAPADLQQKEEAAPEEKSDFKIKQDPPPAFPSGTGFVLDISKVVDRGAPVIIRSDDKNSTEPPQENKGENEDGIRRIHSPALGSLSDADQSRAVRLYKSRTDAANCVNSTSIMLDMNKEGQEHTASAHTPMSVRIRVLDLVDSGHSLVKADHRYFLLSHLKLQRYLLMKDFGIKLKRNKVEHIRLGIPFNLSPGSKELLLRLKQCQHALARCGFVLKVARNSFEISQIPAELKGADLAGCLPGILNEITLCHEAIESGEAPEMLCSLLTENTPCVLNPDPSQMLMNIDSVESLMSWPGVMAEIPLHKFMHNFGGQS